MGTYLKPAEVTVSDDWDEHRARGSAEPGTDYETGVGTDLRIAESGRVSVIDRSNGGAEGRRFTVDLDDGRRVSYIHLDAIADNAYIGQRVARGQTAIIWSGASGNGSDHAYGPHVHVTLQERPGLPYSQTINFEQYLGHEEQPDMDAEQDARLQNIENLLQYPGQGYGWPQVAGQAAQDIQARLAVPGAGYDWLPAVNNKLASMWTPLIASAVASVLTVAAIVLTVRRSR